MLLSLFLLQDVSVLILCSSCVNNHTCEITDTAILSCPEDSFCALFPPQYLAFTYLGSSSILASEPWRDEGENWCPIYSTLRHMNLFFILG